MKIKTVKTRALIPPKDDLFSLIKESFSGLRLKERSIIVFASKIVSIWQGQCLKKDLAKRKDDLIKKESDFYIDRDNVPKRLAILTLKNNILIPTAGIDESNGGGYFILWPKNPFLAARKIYNFIKKNYHLKNFGVIISDTRSIPSRRGTIGFSVAYYGFYPLRDHRGNPDIFGRKIKRTLTNVADSLASAAVLVMGESGEKTPIAIIEDIDFVKFEESNPEVLNPLEVDKNSDIYFPLVSGVKWKKGGSNSNS